MYLSMITITLPNKIITMIIDYIIKVPKFAKPTNKNGIIKLWGLVL